MFQKTYDIKFYEENSKMYLKESALFNLMQDAATLSAESLGFGPSFVFENQVAWVVLKYRVELSEPLHDLSFLTINTEPRGISKICAYRNFEIIKDDKVVGKSSSAWVLIDINTRRMMPIKKLLPDMNEFIKDENDLDYDKIILPEKFDYKKEIEVGFDDIDSNLHVNNANYISWALSSAPSEFRLNHVAKIIDVNFKKEIGEGGIITSETAIDNKNLCSLHAIKNKETQEELCTLKIEWTKI